VYPQRSLRRPRKNVHLGARTAARDSRVFSRLLPRSRDIENSHSDLGSQVGPDLMDTQKFARYHFSATVHTSDAGVLHSLIGLSQWAQCGEKHPQIAWAGCGEKHWRSRGGQTTFRFTSCERRIEWCAKAAELLSGKWALISANDNDPASPPANHYISPMHRPIATRSVGPTEAARPGFRRSA
jgi:hypothetical protein